VALSRTALIVGAGVAGPATALALTKVGIQSTIIEAHPGPADGIGAIITVASNGLNVLRDLGVGEAVASAGQEITQVEMADSTGRTFARHLGGGVLLAREALARILLERAVGTGTRVQYGRRLVGGASHRQGVAAYIDDGSTLEADLLIGADGIHSTVRTLIDPGAPEPVYEGVLGFGGFADGGAVLADSGVMNFVFGRRFLGYWRIPDGRIAWYTALPHERMSWQQIGAVGPAEFLAQLRADMAGHSPTEQLLAQTSPDDLVATGPTLRMPSVPQWTRDRLVLVGDAAHAPSSSSGQGASLALESALEIARCLRDAPDAYIAFSAYEYLRRPRVEAISAWAAQANQYKAGKGSGPVESPSIPQIIKSTSTLRSHSRPDQSNGTPTLCSGEVRRLIHRLALA
jgi:2-polyprenyl-6-methoxyphenol hydroxylase-like FAD-dependent oxidoreductase